MLQTVKMIISYDGTDFCGWQKQKVHAMASPKPSIQETTELALAQIFQQPISLAASGRTDAGVHAQAQVVHFRTEKKIPKDLCWAVRAHLPPSIVAKAAYLAPEDFHATLSAQKKTYRYWIWNQQRPTALLGRYSWWIRQPLDLELLNSYAQCLIQKTDFASFRSVGTPVKHTIRQILQARWWRRSPHLVEFTVTGNGFLKQMVRNLVGTQVELGARREPSQCILAILQAKDRSQAGSAAPPQGLFLSRVYYPKELDNRCRQI